MMSKGNLSEVVERGYSENGRKKKIRYFEEKIKYIYYSNANEFVGEIGEMYIYKIYLICLVLTSDQGFKCMQFKHMI